MPETKIRISKSRMIDFYTCAEHYRRVEAGERDGKTTAMVRGLSVHQAAEHNHKQKMETRRDLPMAQLVEIADASFLDFQQGDIRPTPNEQKIGMSPSLNRARRDARDAVAVYADKVAPKIQPVLVEERIEAEVTGTDVLLTGRIDVLTDAWRLPDLKTTKGRGRSQREVDGSVEFSLYGVLVRHKTGRWPTAYDLEEVNPATGKHRTVTTRRSRGDIEAFVHRLNRMLEAIEKGVYVPAQLGTSWKCSATWCEFWRDCPYVNSARVDAAKNGA